MLTLIKTLIIIAIKEAWGPKATAIQSHLLSPTQLTAHPCHYGVVCFYFSRVTVQVHCAGLQGHVAEPSRARGKSHLYHLPCATNVTWVIATQEPGVS